MVLRLHKLTAVIITVVPVRTTHALLVTASEEAILALAQVRRPRDSRLGCVGRDHCSGDANRQSQRPPRATAAGRASSHDASGQPRALAGILSFLREMILSFLTLAGFPWADDDRADDRPNDLQQGRGEYGFGRSYVSPRACRAFVLVSWERVGGISRGETVA